MKKQSAKSQKDVKGKTKEELYVSIDYPQEGEKIFPGHYAIRISTTKGYTPEISWDGKPWIVCRPSAGFWWYDCKSISRGTHGIEARINKVKKLLKKVFRSCACQ